MAPPQKPKQKQPEGSNNTDRTTSPPPAPPPPPPEPQRPAPELVSDLVAMITGDWGAAECLPPSSPRSAPAPAPTPAWVSRLAPPVRFNDLSSSHTTGPTTPQPAPSASPPQHPSRAARKGPTATTTPASTSDAHVHHLSVLNKLLDKKVPLTSAEAHKRLRLTYMLDRNNLSPINIEEDNLFLGRYRATLDPLLLSTFGITHIVNCGRGYHRDEVAHARFGYLHIKATDNTEERLAPYFTQACGYIEKALKSGGKVLIHCAAGVSRSAAILLAYLIRSRRWTLQTAFDFAKDKRSIIRPNPAFCTEMLGWEQEVLGVRTTDTLICRQNRVEAWPVERMDWRQAMSVMFAAGRCGDPVCRDTGMAHLLWDEFKKAFGDGHGVSATRNALSAILVEALYQISANQSRLRGSAAARATELAIEFKTLHAVLVMGSKYVPHVLPSEFMQAVHTVLESSITIQTRFDHETTSTSTAAFMSALEETMDKWLDQRIFTVYRAHYPDWNNKKIEVWEPAATLARGEKPKKRKFGVSERAELFKKLLPAQKRRKMGGGERQKIGVGIGAFVLDVVERPKARGEDLERVNEAIADGKASAEERAEAEEKKNETVADGAAAIEQRMEEAVANGPGESA